MSAASSEPVAAAVPEVALDYAAPPAPIVDHRAERGRRLKWNIFTSLLLKPLSVLTPIITVRLFVEYLGTERYGLYESVAALAVWLSLTNVGLTLGLINKLTECHVSGDRELARRYVSSLTIALFALVLAGCIVVALIVPFVNWQWIFPTTTALSQAETPWAVLAASWCSLTALLMGIPISVYTAHQEHYRINYWDAAAKIATILACFAVVHTNWGLVGVVLAAAGASVLVRVPNLVTLFAWEKPWLAPHLNYFDWSLLKSSMKHGLGLFIVQMSALAIFQADKLVISVVLGPESVVGYAITGRAFMLIFGLYMLLINPLWPAYGEALRRGDREWVRISMFRSLAFGIATMTACGIVMFFWGQWILAKWTGNPDVVVSRSLVIAMTALFVMWTVMSGLSIVLNAAGVVRLQTYFIGSHALLNVILAVILAKTHGVLGVAWSMTITGLLTSAWGYPWMIRKYVTSRAA